MGHKNHYGGSIPLEIVGSKEYFHKIGSTSGREELEVRGNVKCP